MELEAPKNKVLRVRTSEGRMDFIHGDKITSAGLVKERGGKYGDTWSLVLNYQSQFYTKITNTREMLRTIESLYGKSSLEEAEGLIGVKLKDLPAESSKK